MGSFTFLHGEYKLREGSLSWVDDHAEAWLTTLAFSKDNDELKVFDPTMCGLHPQTITGKTVIEEYPLLRYDAADTVWPHGDYSASGCIITLNRQPICYNYLGGVNTVTQGVFTCVWSNKGLLWMCGPVVEKDWSVDIAKAARSVRQWLTAVPE